MSGPFFQVAWTDVARRDLIEIAEYISRQSPTAALQLVERIERRCETLKSMPSRGRIPPELARFRVHQYHELLIEPYRVFYRIEDSSVTVLAVFDGRRDLEDVLIGRLLSF